MHSKQTMLRLILDLEGEPGPTLALFIRHQSHVRRNALFSGTLTIHSNLRGQ